MVDRLRNLKLPSVEGKTSQQVIAGLVEQFRDLKDKETIESALREYEQMLRPDEKYRTDAFKLRFGFSGEPPLSLPEIASRGGPNKRNAKVAIADAVDVLRRIIQVRNEEGRIDDIRDKPLDMLRFRTMTRNLLLHAGCRTIGDILLRFTEEELLATRGSGPDILDEIKTELERRGLRFYPINELERARSFIKETEKILDALKRGRARPHSDESEAQYDRIIPAHVEALARARRSPADVVEVSAALDAVVKEVEGDGKREP